MVAFAAALRGQNRSERSVFIKAEQQRDDDRQSAAAENVRAENPVFRSKNEQSDKNPKGHITLIATSHKNLLCYAAGDM